MRQSSVHSRLASTDRAPGPSYRPLLLRLSSRLEALVEAVARDVALPDQDPGSVAREVRPAVAWTLDALTAAEQLTAAHLAILEGEGRQAAIAGESLQRLLDRYLSTGWVVWEAATGEHVDAPLLAALGTALLKAGDSAAAAIAQAYGTAERELALRAAAARREFVDEVLDLPVGDPEAAARLRRRADAFGLEPAGTYRVVVATLDVEAGDAEPELDLVARAIEGAGTPASARPATGGAGQAVGSRLGPLVTARRGRLVMVIPVGQSSKGESASTTSVEAMLESHVPGRWLAVAAGPVSGLAHVSEAYADAVGSVGVAQRVGRRGLVDANEVLLERALLVDESLLALAVGRELGPILGAARNGAVLLATFDAFVEAAGNLRATARALGVAPRTVGYRVARIETLIGEPLAGPRLARLTTAAFGYRLLSPSAVVPATATDSSPIRSRRRPVSPASARSRPGPPGRSRRRRFRGRAT